MQQQQTRPRLELRVLARAQSKHVGRHAARSYPEFGQPVTPAARPLPTPICLSFAVCWTPGVLLTICFLWLCYQVLKEVCMRGDFIHAEALK
jgi:hypothetical protein